MAAQKRRRDHTRYCEIEGCERPHKAKGFCNLHYLRQFKGLPLDYVKQKIYKECIVEDCVMPGGAKGFCQGHYTRHIKGKDLYSPPLKRRKIADFCTVPGCGGKHSGRGFCAFHYQRHVKNIDFDRPKKRYIAAKSFEDVYWYTNNHGYIVGNLNAKLVQQHRVIWEMHHGRKLKPFENIHHKNGIRTDNRIENLELWTKSQPSGQRPEDLVDWVLEHYRELIIEKLESSRP